MCWDSDVTYDGKERRAGEAAWVNLEGEEGEPVASARCLEDTDESQQGPLSFN